MCNCEKTMAVFVGIVVSVASGHFSTSPIASSCRAASVCPNEVVSRNYLISSIPTLTDRLPYRLTSNVSSRHM